MFVLYDIIFDYLIDSHFSVPKTVKLTMYFHQIIMDFRDTLSVYTVWLSIKG